MPISFEIILDPSEASEEEKIQEKVLKKYGIDPKSAHGFHILKRSMDARRHPVKIRIAGTIYLKEDEVPDEWIPEYKNVSGQKEVAIIGAGPAGLFAALRLIELNIKPVLFERGKAVKERRRDLAKITREHTVNPDSNYCFGEGGAGTYSDGKLYTRSGKRGSIERILNILRYHGAEDNILYEAHPHIGTNKLPLIIEKIRKTILDCGGEIHFNKRLTDINSDTSGIRSIKFQDETSFDANAVILATGHSSRDIFELLNQKKLTLEAKAFALGVRIEHPQKLIDSIQYHCVTRSPYLPPAAYSLVEQVNGRGVFSFCMCPGGIIAPAATSPGEIVVNGWSPSKRNNPFANSGMVVSVDQNDFKKYYSEGALAALFFQREVEQNAFELAGKTLAAPAQRMQDFINKKHSSSLPECSYLPGINSVDLDSVLPTFISKALREGLSRFGKKMKGYLTNEAVLVGVESRTSSPVRIPRDKISLQHPDLKGLFPCGEGAGYAGGIVSAAMDGERCANQLIDN